MNWSTLRLIAGMTSLLMCSSCFAGSSSKAPIFTKEILLAKMAGMRLNEPLHIPAQGKYKISVDLYQKKSRHGSPVEIKGVVKIFDSSGAMQGRQVVKQSMRANQVGLDLWIFDAKEVGGAGDKRLEILVSSEGAELQKQYTKAVVYILPVHKRGFLD